ncbi:MAG: peptidyl-prolyl cis-trans isomerase [Candidatus Celaenobacter antarcticus]|nr:peptidyl-prolyl cis-trans isomerase [Candidatus Celaenobacter antarcticus]
MVLAGCELGEKGKDKTQVLAQWDGGTITEKVFNERLDQIPQFYRPRGGFTVEQKQKYLDDYAIEEIFYIEALSKGMENTQSAQEFYRQNAERVILDKYYQEQIKDKIKPTDTELTTFYEAHKDDFYKKSPTATLLYIETKTKENADAAYQELVSGKEFVEVMNVYTTNENLKKKGGLITNIRKGGYIPNIGRSEELDSLIFVAEINDIIPPIEFNDAFHIVKVTDIDLSTIRPYDEVEKDVSSRYASEKEQTLRKDILNKLFNKYNVSIDTLAVKDVNFEEADTSDIAGSIVLIASSDPELVYTAMDFAHEVSMFPMERKQLLQEANGKVDFINEKANNNLLYHDAMKKGYENHPEIADELRRAKMIGALREYYKQFVVDAAVVPEEELVKAYEADKEKRYVNKPHVKVQEFACENQVTADFLLFKAKEAQTPEELNALIKEYCVKTANDGMIGPIYEGGIIPGVGKDDLYLEKIFAVPEGSFSDVFEDVKGNWLFFKVIEFTPKSYRSIDDVRAELETNLMRKAQQDLFEKLKTEMRQKYNLVVYPDRLEEKLPVDSLFTIAEESMTQKNYARANYYYDKVIEEYPNGQDDYKAKFMKGFIYSEYLKNDTKAIEMFKEVLTYPREGTQTDTTLHPSARYMLKALTGEEDILEKINQQSKQMNTDK